MDSFMKEIRLIYNFQEYGYYMSDCWIETIYPCNFKYTYPVGNEIIEVNNYQSNFLAIVNIVLNMYKNMSSNNRKPFEQLILKDFFSFNEVVNVLLTFRKELLHKVDTNFIMILEIISKAYTIENDKSRFCFLVREIENLYNISKNISPIIIPPTIKIDKNSLVEQYFDIRNVYFKPYSFTFKNQMITRISEINDNINSINSSAANSILFRTMFIIPTLNVLKQTIETLHTKNFRISIENSVKINKNKYYDIEKQLDKLDVYNLRLFSNKLVSSYYKFPNVFFITERFAFEQRLIKIVSENIHFIVLTIPFSSQYLMLKSTIENEMLRKYSDNIVGNRFDKNDFNIDILMLSLLYHKSYNIFSKIKNVICFGEHFLVYSPDLADLLKNLKRVCRALIVEKPVYAVPQFPYFEDMKYYSKLYDTSLKVFNITLPFNIFERRELIKYKMHHITQITQTNIDREYTFIHDKEIEIMDDIIEDENDNRSIKCLVCFENINIVLYCGHSYCSECKKKMERCYICGKPALSENVIYQ